MRKSFDYTFDLEDSQKHRADCRVRIFIPASKKEASDPILLVSWATSSPEFATGPWLEHIIGGFRAGLADAKREIPYLLIEHYAAGRYQHGPFTVDYEEELGLVTFKDALPQCNSPAANLRAGKRTPQVTDNAPAVRERRSVYWLPICRDAVEDVVGESLDAPALPNLPEGFKPVFDAITHLN